MKSNGNKIDELIHEALSAEESQYFDSMKEPSLMGEALGLLKGKNRALSVAVMLVTIILMAVCVYSAISFFNATETQDLLMWLGVFFTGFGSIAAIKIWSWMEMDKNALMREIKRLELQISFLIRKLEG